MIVLFVISFLCILLYYLSTKNYNYWSNRNVAHPKPVPFFGNYREYILFRKCDPKIAQEICQQFPNEPYIGVYYGTSPALIIKDPNLIKLVMHKDFYYFNHREVGDHVHKELMTQNLFFTGGDQWRVLRQNLTPLFSSAKIKSMFYFIANCASNLDKVLSEDVKTREVIEIRSILSKYTIDCIGSCVFGVNTGSLRENSKNGPFTVLAQKLFDRSYYGGLKLVARSMWPTTFYGLGFTLFDNYINVFVKDFLSNVLKNRDHNDPLRNNFVDHILKWKKKEYLSGDGVVNLKSDNKKSDQKEIIEIKVDDTLVVAQCALMFAAGFETTSSTTSHLLFEIAKHKDIQNQVIDEVDAYYKKTEGKLYFECINDTPYIQACLEETLRLYPVIPNITREVREDYVLPTGLKLEKGMRIHFPIFYLHRNEEYFSKPENFRPERFLGDEKKKIQQYTYIPFGEGHRICIGIFF